MGSIQVSKQKQSNPTAHHPPRTNSSSSKLNGFSRYASPVLRFLSVIFTLISYHSLSVTASDLFKSRSKGQHVLGLEIIITVPSIYEVLHNFFKALSQALSFLILITLYGTYFSCPRFFSRIAC